MRAYSVITGTLLVAMLMSIMRMPVSILWIRPEFVLLVLIYWALAIPQYSGFAVAWFAGLLQDSLTASVLGTHAFVYLLVVAFVLFSYQRLRMLRTWQQSVVVFHLMMGAELLETWFDYLSGHGEFSMHLVIPALLGSLLWPWLKAALRTMRRKHGLLNKLI